MTKISEKQRRIAKLKAEGKKNKEIGQLEYPQASPEAQAVMISRELKKPNVAQYYAKELTKTLNEYGVTKSQYFMNIGLAMQANKMNQFTGEITPDYTVRLNANKQAERFLNLEEDQPKIDDIDLSDMNELELTKAVFRKG